MSRCHGHAAGVMGVTCDGTEEKERGRERGKRLVIETLQHLNKDMTARWAAFAALSTCWAPNDLSRPTANLMSAFCSSEHLFVLFLGRGRAELGRGCY